MTPVLAIDQSTSSTKACVLDARGEVVSEAARSHRTCHPRPGWVEQDGDEIWDNLLKVCREALHGYPVKPERVSLTNQRESFLCFDRSGKPLTPVIVWQCRRGTAICRERADEARKIGLERRTGLLLDTYFSAPKLSVLLRDNPDLKAGMDAGKILFGTIDAYLVYRMTEGKVHASDATNASRTLLFNLESGDWDADQAGLFNVPMKALPEIRDSSGNYGNTRLDGILPGPVPVQGIMGDSQASLLAQHCIEPGTTKATFGTGTSLLMKTEAPLPEPTDGVVNALAWRIDGRDEYAVEGIVNFSAATLNWLRDALGLFQSFEEAEGLASAVPDSGGVLLIPAFVGLGAPYWAPEARASICGLTPHSNRSHVIRAAYESIALQIADNLDLLQSITGNRPTCLRGDGGPTRSRFLTGLAASLISCPLDVNRQPLLSPMGAVLAGRIGAGEIQMESLSGDPPAGIDVIAPSLSHAEADRLRDAWRKALQAYRRDG